MINLYIVNPIKMRVVLDSDDELYRLKKALTFKNNSVEYQIKMTRNSAARYGQIWAQKRIAELKENLYECLLWEDEEGYYTRPGLLDYIMARFHGSVKFENLIAYPEFQLMPWHNQPQYEPHRAQAEAVERLLKNPHSHIEFATGTGKSYIIQLLIKKTGLPTVVSTPSITIARQLYNECIHLFGKNKVGLLGDSRRDIGKHILIAVGKSLSLISIPEEVEAFKKYQVLISDESHTLPADIFEKFCHGILSHCPYRWFVSGTQERADGTELKLISIIGKKVHSYSIQQAITDGVLAKLSFLIFNVESPSLFESQNIVRMNQEHFYKNERIARAIAEIAAASVANGDPVLILVDEHIQNDILKRYMTVDYAYACSDNDNNDICEKFNKGEIMCVVGTSAVSTGTNFKPVKLTINWQAGKSSVKIKQGAIGRSTRIDKDAGKSECKIVDFRVVNVRQLKRHADIRISYYKQIGEVMFANL